MSGHTPGPWEVDGVEVFGADGKHVVWELGNDNAADRALIAAAPELLAALKALVLKTEQCDNPSEHGVWRYSDEMIAARAVIDKTEGAA